MPNRIIKESIRTSYEINELSIEAEITFYRLLTFADDYGRFPSDARVLQAALFPLRPDIRSKDFTRWVAELVSAGLIMLYISEDMKPFGFFVNWHRHQNQRAKTSKYPEPGGPAYPTIQKQMEAIKDKKKNMNSDDITCNHVDANVPVLVLDTRTRYSNLDTRVRDARTHAREGPDPPDATPTPGIEQFDDPKLEELYQKYLDYRSKERHHPVGIYEQEEQRMYLKQLSDPKGTIRNSLRCGYKKLVPPDESKAKKGHGKGKHKSRLDQFTEIVEQDVGDSG